jgi:hypothetical protein
MMGIGHSQWLACASPEKLVMASETNANVATSDLIIVFTPEFGKFLSCEAGRAALVAE